MIYFVWPFIVHRQYYFCLVWDTHKLYLSFEIWCISHPTVIFKMYDQFVLLCLGIFKKQDITFKKFRYITGTNYVTLT